MTYLAWNEIRLIEDAFPKVQIKTPEVKKRYSLLEVRPSLEVETIEMVEQEYGVSMKPKAIKRRRKREMKGKRRNLPQIVPRVPRGLQWKVQVLRQEFTVARNVAEDAFGDF